MLKFRISMVLKFTLIFTGSIPTSAKYITAQRIGVFLGILSYILLFHSVIWSAVNYSSNIAVISESLSYSVFLVSSFTTVVIIWLNKRIFIRVIQRLNNEPESSIEQMNTQFFRTLLTIFKVYLAEETLYFVAGVTASSFGDAELGSQESQYSPGYIPWDNDTPLKYTLSLLYQALLMVYPVTINNATYAALVGFYVFINFKFQQLLALINHLTSCENPNLLVGSDLEYNHHLAQVIGSYQDWKSFSRDIAAFVGGYSSAVLFGVFLCSMWCIALITENEISITLKVKSTCFVMYTMIHLVIICLFGEYFQEKDAEIGNAMYNTSWYNMSHQSRKMTSLVIMLTQTVTQVKAYGMIFVNASYSIRVLKAIYSAMNLYRKSFAD